LHRTPPQRQLGPAAPAWALEQRCARPPATLRSVQQ